MIVATAGHVDHGKSTLVRLLTGTDPDRWAEEKQRGLTIDLGFAWMSGDNDVDGLELAFVDVPGHRQFLPNMLAGCGSVDIALLVVSASEGWMLQTEEHSQILDLLGVADGVIAITHTDTVDAAQLLTVKRAVAERLQGTSLHAAPMVATSPFDPSTIEVLRAALLDVAQQCRRTTEVDFGRPRLWIDRSFIVNGTGRVVTGTLAGGSVAHGDDVVVTSGGAEASARIRGVRANGRSVARAAPGARVGLALARQDSDLAPARGDAIVRGGQWSSGNRWRVAVTAVRGSSLPRARGGYRVFVGTANAAAQLRYGGGALRGSAPASQAPQCSTTELARLHLTEAIGPVSIGDRFILRDSGSEETVGGGVVLAIDDELRPYHDQDLLCRLRAVSDRGLPRSSDAGTLLGRILVQQAGGCMPLTSLRRLIGPIGDDEASLGAGLQLLRSEVVLTSELAHRQQSILDDVDRDGSLPVPDDALGRLTAAELVSEGLIERHGAYYRPAGTRSNAQAGALVEIIRLIDAADPPMLSQDRISAISGIEDGQVAVALASGDLAQIGSLITTKAQYDRLVRLVADMLAKEPASVGAIRDRLGLSRRVVIPLLETLDAAGMTSRTHNMREWIGPT